MWLENCTFLGYCARVVAISYRRFGTVYLAHIQGSRIQNLLDSHRVMTQKSVVLRYSVAEA